ncbi:PAS domain S-box-containing protein [Bryocella elongata]|uniref:histidine kinase n=1 Tax=Bryocella elongata TaxID=863522 RepID=A0A1H5TWP7_9BACT|nr:ATP-binding protein [Bryocella elongata]SEF66628.1 PAS domain S-box-containing protein [Bryocella elongata]
MKNGAQTRLLALLLAIITLAAAGLAIANLVQEGTYVPPTDGAPKIEVRSGLEIYMVPAGTPADRAGLRAGDILTAINDVPTPRMAVAERLLEASGIWSKAKYTVLRHPRAGGPPASIDISIILEPADRTDHQVMRLIALVYLAIGLYVLFRRWTAPKSTHFYVFCLVSFILYAFKYTAVFDGLDLTVLTANFIAAALQPALFLHFALSFTGESETRRRHRWVHALLYIPGAVLATLRFLSLEYWSPTQRLQHRLDKIDYAYLATYYILAAVVFWVRYLTERRPLERQQLKWLSRGTVLTTLPFTAIYVVPFLFDWSVPRNLTNLAVFALILLPLTFSWAIVRYRLMDVDLIFKRGVTYTLVTAALVGSYFGLIALAAEVVHNQVKSERLRDWGLILAVIVTGLVFDPLKRMVQGHVDRIFDRKKIDYRTSLVEFGKELNAQTDLRALIDSIVERLPETLLVTRVAVFLAQEYRTPRGRVETRFTLAGSHGLSQQVASAPESLDLGFLDFDRRDSGTHLFFENAQAVLRLPESERRAASALDLNYFVPCRAARHEGSGLSTIAVLGLGRTGDGDFLSSEDMELLESLAGYTGIAIQNAQLYQRLEQKITDFERLRDFNENIVESINIGVFAVDLEDCIESWNAQMEVMYATARADALRKPLNEVFPPEFLTEFDRVRDEQGTSTLYKFRLPTPTGEARIANITIAPLLNRDFQAVGRIIIVDDISDRVNMETQLTQAEKLSSIGLLAAGVAHEVNTPLAVISSYAQMLNKQLSSHLAQDENGRARLQPVLDKIIQQTFRASEIANGLLNFSRMGTTDFSRTDVNATVRETVMLLEHPMRSAGITVTTELAEGLPVVNGNRGKLQQVLVNLVLNAKDALQEKSRGTVRIVTTAPSNGQSVEIRVEDDGCGMSAEVMRRIYDPFFTTKLAPKDGQRKGTGLGMAVTYGIVQEHSGTIEVSSSVGEGTVFRLEFPALDAPSRTELRATGPEGNTEEGKVVHV